MKFLLLPGNNPLSHIAKSPALEAELSARGHQVLIAVSKKHSPFLDRLHIVHTVLPDIQEADDGPAPSWEWFPPRRPHPGLRSGRDRFDAPVPARPHSGNISLYHQDIFRSCGD